MKAAELFKRADEVYGMRKTAFLAGIEAYCRVNGMNMQQAFIMTKVAEEMLEGSGDVNEAVEKVALSTGSSIGDRINSNPPPPMPASKPMPSVGGISQNPLSAPSGTGVSSMPPRRDEGSNKATTATGGGFGALNPDRYGEGGTLDKARTTELNKRPEPISPNAHPAEKQRYDEQLARYNAGRDDAIAKQTSDIKLMYQDNLKNNYGNAQMAAELTINQFPEARRMLEDTYRPTQEGPDAGWRGQAAPAPAPGTAPAAAGPGKTGPLSP